MARTNQQGRVKLIVTLVAGAIIIAGLAAVVTLATSKHSAAKTKQATTTEQTTSSLNDNQYKLTACKSGATQTIGNASYTIGTDFAPGSYKVTSNAGDIGWSNINIYSSKANYDKQGDPSNEQGVAAQSLAPQNGTTTVTKLDVDADTATFVCE
jgi:hypothetical protein